MTKNEIQKALNALDGPGGFTVTTLTPYYGNLADVTEVPAGTGYFGTVRLHNNTIEPATCRLTATGPKGKGDPNVDASLQPGQHLYIGETLFNKIELSNCAAYFTGYRITYKF